MDFSWLFDKASLEAYKVVWQVFLMMAAIAVPAALFRLLLVWLDRKVTSRPSSASRPISTLNKGKALEVELEGLFKALGYQVHRTPLQGDWGVDLIIQDARGRRIAIQAKNWSGKVGVEAIYQVHSGKDYYKCHAARVIAPNGFTEQAEQAAAVLGVELWSQKQLSALRQHVRRLKEQARNQS